MSRGRTIAAVVAAGVALALAVWIGSRRGGERSPARSAAAAGAPATDEHAHARRAALQTFPDPATEELPGVHCWQGLLDIDRAGSFDDLRGVLARALGSGDELLARYVADRLVELVGGDAAQAHRLLDWAAETAGPESEVLLGALARTAAVHDAGIRERILRTAEDRGGDVGRRAAAIGALETQRRLDAATLGRVTALALDRDAGGAAWTATRTIGRVMKEDHARTGAYEPYWDQLMEISARTRDPEVRILALEMPAYVDPVLGAPFIEELATLLRTAPEREVREMAAFQLGLTADPQRVLAVFRAAFPAERDLCVRWAMLRFAVRAGGPRALPVLDEMAGIDTRFAADVADFRRIYATGLEDFERVWLDKAEHHACSADEHGDGGAS
jgi:hypothetical protein